MLKTSSFKPAWWLSNRHLQTMAAKILRRNQTVAVINETVELPDGDFVDLAWTEDPNLHPLKPIVYVLHGLEGSINSHYAKGMMGAIKAKGWIGLLMHFRGCSGRPNRQGPSYHSGDTWDIHYCTEHLKERFVNRPVAILGFSLGGNVLANYLAEDPNNPFRCAAVICAPLHLASCSTQIDQGFSKVYQKYLVDMLKDSTTEKIKLKLISHIELAELEQIKTLFEFDQKVTAPINGFESAEDYYEKASGLYQLDKITKPTLIIHAMDDPFLCHKYLNKIPENSSINLEVSKHGGHVGFISGRNPFKPQYWLENRVLNFIEEQFSK
ncbi:hydrolase [Thalassotalea psychrophila]|uniref:Hydrolase n=1 Tax=Thalassotalea psychrophila TaxID=3065647 RepID=A0ABY9TSV5_9GAMM|nr:hydrolase [Colwelliaceae bacterium SQ149]